MRNTSNYYSLADNLNRIYESFITEKNGRFFYAGIYDYIDYIFSNSEIERIIENIKKDEVISNKKLNQINTSFKNELNLVENDIRKIIWIKKIKNKEIDRNLSVLDLIKKLEKKDIYGDNLKHKYKFLVQILELLNKIGFKNEIDKYFQSNKGCSDYEFSKFYDSQVKEMNALKLKKRVSMWGCWNELVEKYSIISVIEGKNNKGISKEVIDICQSMQTVEDKLQINSIKTSQDFKMPETKLKVGDEDIEEIKYCAKRIHNYLINELSNEKYLISPEVGQKFKLSFSGEKGIYDGSKFSYPIKGKRAKLIMLLKDGKKDGALLVKTLGAKNISFISKEIAEINKNFKSKFKQSKDLIIHIETGGYRLNADNYSIEFMDEP